MNNSYRKYIDNRLKGGCEKSNQHLCAITAVDYYGADKEFYLLQFYNSECLLLKCITNDSNQVKRIGIVSCSKFQHGLNEIYKNDINNKVLIDKYEEAYFLRTDGVYQYDSYYNKLSPSLNEYKSRIAAALKEIQLKDYSSVFICYNKNYSTKAVVYALQEKTAKVVMMQEVKENLNIIETKRVLHLQNFNKMYLNTVPIMSVADCFFPQTIYIPMDEVTLGSEFCNGTTWGDLTANTETSDYCTINGISCKCVTIKMTIDIFNNVFCSMQSFNGEKKTILLHNALDVEINMSGDYPQKHSLKNAEKRQTQIIKEKANHRFDKDERSIEKKKDNRRTSIQTNSQSDKKDDKFYELVKEIDIMSGDTGHSYRTLFGDYLNNESVVVLSEPYLVHSWQWNNLKEFISFLIEIGHVKTFTLKSKRPDSVEIPETMERSKFIRDYNKKLNSIKKELSSNNVYFTWELSDTHKRFLITDNYRFNFDHGLHLYNRCEEETVLNSSVFKKCKENHIEVYKRVKLNS